MRRNRLGIAYAVGLTVLSFVALAGPGISAKGWTDPVEASYSSIWDGFYGPGKGKTLFKAYPALLPDGRPEFIVDEKTDEVSLPIFLEVDSSAFESWRQGAHRRLEALGAAQCRLVAIGDAEARIIGGKAFRFSNNAEAWIRNWEKSNAAKKAAIAVRVEIFNAKDKQLGRWYMPLMDFTRQDCEDFPVPLRNLNRLLDIPPSVWNWIAPGMEPGVDAERATKKLTLTKVSPRMAKTVVKVRCAVVDELDFMPIFVEKASDELKKLERNMVPVPERDFLFSRYEVTQALWESVMKVNPSRFKDPVLPVENVSWEDCRLFIEKINLVAYFRLRGHVYRFPTEEEWEYACRAGSTGTYCITTNGTEVSEETLDDVAWFGGNSEKKTHPVGSKTPNAFGLYDMIGNVWEWTSTVEETDRITKGGGWNGDAGRCESANRNRFFPSHRFPFLGLRLVRETVDPR